jgi:hypothetical protein
MSIILHPSAFEIAAGRLGKSSGDLRSQLAELLVSIEGSDLDAEFKEAMIPGLRRWIGELDRLIPRFQAAAPMHSPGAERIHIATIAATTGTDVIPDGTGEH